MRSLTLRLLLMMLGVALVAAVLMFVLVNVTRTSNFQALLIEQETANLERLITAYYTTNGTLAGLFEPHGTAAEPPPGARRGAPPPLPPPLTTGTAGRIRGTVAVIAPDGQVLVPTRGVPAQRVRAPATLPAAVPITVDATTVAYLVPSPHQTFALRREEAQYLERTNHALLLATLGATVTALLVGALFARTITRPLRELTGAAHAIQQGELGRQVPVRSQDELGQLAATFNAMSRDLQQAVALRNQMTANIAHDLRTPLQVIGGYITAMHDGDLAPTHERLATVSAEVTHLQRLVADLGLLTRSDAGELHIQTEPTALRPLLAHVIARHIELARQQQVSLVLVAPDELPTLALDTRRMVQVLGNLLDNALRHTPAGGTVTLGAAWADQQVTLTVSDTGEGITPADLPNVFERLYRADAARSNDDTSVGLGLAIAKALVVAHGGTITAWSAGTGTGATFTIALPYQPTTA